MLIAGLIILLTASVCFPASTAPDALAWGPENGGLRMNLQIDPAEANQPDCYKVTVRIANVSKSPVTLIAEWASDSEKGDYPQYMQEKVFLKCTPDVHRNGYQTMDPSRTRSQPSLKLASGDIMTCQWFTTRLSLDPRGGKYASMHFPFNGLYAIEAHFFVALATGGHIQLYSNVCQLAVGGSDAMPKTSVTEVIDSEPISGTVILSAGALQKIEPNDAFTCMQFRSTWQLVVTRVENTRSICRVEKVYKEAGKNVAPVPPKGLLAFMQTTAPGTPKPHPK